MFGSGFAVIDFETTGLSPAKHERVIEVAVVHVGEHGREEGQWETLINPGLDLGRQDVHRIRQANTKNGWWVPGLLSDSLCQLTIRVFVLICRQRFPASARA